MALAAAAGMRAAFVAVAVTTALSGIVVAIRMDTSQPTSRKEVVAIRTEAR